MLFGLHVCRMCVCACVCLFVCRCDGLLACIDACCFASLLACFSLTCWCALCLDVSSVLCKRVPKLKNSVAICARQCGRGFLWQASAVMPAALGFTDLMCMNITEEELAKAKEVLAAADGKKHKSNQGCFTSWLKANPQPTDCNHDNKTKFMHAFLVHQLRAKNRVRRSETTKTHDVVKTKARTHFEWGREKMKTELGEQKALGIIESGKLSTQPCSITGSTAEHMLEFIVPVAMTQYADYESNKHAVSSAGDATADDAVIFDAPKDDNPQKGKDGGLVQVKKEGKDQKDRKEEEYEAFQAAKEDHLKRFQQMELETRQWIVALKHIKYSEGLTGDLQKHLQRLGGLTRILARAAAEVIQKSEFPKLKKSMDAMQAAHSTHSANCSRFGVPTKNIKRRRRS